MISANNVIEPGQLYALAFRGLFIVESTRRTDSLVAVVREVARHPAYAQTAESTVRGYANTEPACSNAERAARWAAMSVWEQDEEWFRRRADLSRWTGTVEHWVAAHGGSV